MERRERKIILVGDKMRKLIIALVLIAICTAGFCPVIGGGGGVIIDPPIKPPIGFKDKLITVTHTLAENENPIVKSSFRGGSPYAGLNVSQNGKMLQR